MHFRSWLTCTADPNWVRPTAKFLRAGDSVRASSNLGTAMLCSCVDSVLDDGCDGGGIEEGKSGGVGEM